jgi:hypothetical protein
MRQLNKNMRAMTYTSNYVSSSSYNGPPINWTLTVTEGTASSYTSVTSDSISGTDYSSVTTTIGVSPWYQVLPDATVPNYQPQYLGLKLEIDELKRLVEELVKDREARELKFKDSIEQREPTAKRVLDL